MRTESMVGNAMMKSIRPDDESFITESSLNKTGEIPKKADQSLPKIEEEKPELENA